MRILVLMVQYAPALNPNVIRWAAIAGHWVGQGHEVHVLCSKHSARPGREIMEGVHVHRAGQATLMDWAYNLLRRSRRRSEPGAGLALPGLASRILEQLVHLTWRKLYWPDGSCLWYFPARRRALSLLAAQPFDAVISVGLPFTAHLVGMACKERFPALRWLMDVEDPFCFAEEFPANNFSLYRRLNYRMEGRAFRRADAVALTNPDALRRYAGVFPDAASRLRVIPPLYHLPAWRGDAAAPREEVGEIHLGYFGAFYHKIRSPQGFLDLLEAAFRLSPPMRKRLRVHFYGYLEPEFSDMFARHPELLPNLVFHGLASREETAAAMQAMDILLHIGNTTDYHLPSKCTDYLFSGKPVINIAASDRDSFRAFAGERAWIAHLHWAPGQDPEPPARAFLEAVEKLPAVAIPALDPSPFEVERISGAYGEAL